MRGVSTARVLVVDDEPAVREALRRALALEGYDVDLAADGAEALRTVARRRAGRGRPRRADAEVDGLDACRRLRAEGNRVPMLMLTARDGVGDRVDGLDAGADDYLVKPFALEELLARIRALLRRGGAERGERAAALRGPRARPGDARGAPRRRGGSS